MSENGLRVLVVGGGRGIGAAIVGRLAERGHVVGVCARTVSEVEQTAGLSKQAGGRVEGFPGDAESSRFGDVVGGFVEWAGGLDALVYTAGRLRAIGPAATLPIEECRRDLDATLLGFLNVYALVHLFLLKSPRACAIATVGRGFNQELAFAAAHAAAQAGLVRLIECLDAENRDKGMPIYGLNPGIVPTEMTRHVLDSKEGRRYLPAFGDAFAEGKEVGPDRAAISATWLIENRPRELSGRVVSALIDPSLLEMRLERIASEDLHRLRMR